MHSEISGLVVQGGAMRAIYSMAVLSMLQRQGRRYDHVLGASAGAMNAAYFVAGQSDDSLAAYLTDINVRAFINPWRLAKIVNTDYLVDEIFKKLRPLSIDRIRQSAATLHIAVTDYETGEGSFVTNRDQNIDLFEALRATAAVPLFYGHPVTLGGRRYIDGGIRHGIAFQKALDLGCTDITVVLTQPLEFRRKFGLQLFERLLLARYPGATKAAILAEGDTTNQALDLISKNLHSDTLRVTVIAPSNPARMVSFTQNMVRSRLDDCVKMAKEDALHSLGQ